MTLLLQAELRKLLRSRGVIAGAVLAVLLMWFYQSRGYGFAKDIRDSEASLSKVLDHPEQACPTRRGVCADELFRQNPGLREEQEEGRQQARRDLAVARTTLSPAGGIPVVLGLLGSAIGITLGLMTAAVAVGMETANRTLRTCLVRQPRRVKFLTAKLGASVVLLVTLAGISIGFLALSNLLLTPDLATSGEGGVAWRSLGLPPMWLQVAVPLLVLTLFTALGTVFAFWLRSGLAAVVGPGVLIVTDWLIARSWRAAAPHTLSFNIWSLTKGFRSEAANRMTTIWVWAEFPFGERSEVGALVFLLAVLVLVVAVGIAIFRRQEI